MITVGRGTFKRDSMLVWGFFNLIHHFTQLQNLLNIHSIEPTSGKGGCDVLIGLLSDSKHIDDYIYCRFNLLAMLSGSQLERRQH